MTARSCKVTPFQVTSAFLRCNITLPPFLDVTHPACLLLPTQYCQYKYSLLTTDYQDGLAASKADGPPLIWDMSVTNKKFKWHWGPWQVHNKACIQACTYTAVILGDLPMLLINLEGSINDQGQIVTHE